MKIPFYTTALFVMVIMSCKNNTASESVSEEPETENFIKLTTKQFENGNFKIEKPDSTLFYQDFKVTGYIDVPPDKRASINTYFNGFIDQIDLIEGDNVKKNDLLVTLQNPEFINVQQQFLENYSQLEFLESEFNRKQNLLNDKVISQKQFQQTKSEYLSMKAKVLGQRKTLQLMNVNVTNVLSGNFSERISLYSPIDGQVSKVAISKGKYVDQNTTIMEILNTEHIHLELDVFEKDITKINVGDTLSFKVPEVGNENFKAYVKLVGAEVRENRSVRIHAHPIIEQSRFAVGMFIEAKLKHASKMKLSLPETAFVKKEDKWVVLKLKHQKNAIYYFEAIEVEQTTAQSGSRALITDQQLSPDDQFLTNGGFDLVTGM